MTKDELDAIRAYNDNAYSPGGEDGETIIRLTEYIDKLIAELEQVTAERDVLVKFLDKATKLQIPPGQLLKCETWQDFAYSEVAKRKENKS